MPSANEPTREPFLKKMFFGSSGYTEREEKVLHYIIHRVNEETPLHDVIREDYVRRNCTQEEIREIINHPELVHACREHLWQTFRSGELEPGRGRRRVAPRRDAGDAAWPGARSDLMGERSTPPGSCDHSGLVRVERVGGCYRVRCMGCREAGPARKTPEAAHKALLVLGVRDGATTTEPTRPRRR